MIIHAFPASNKIAQKHFRDTVENKIETKLLRKYIKDSKLSNKLIMPSYSIWGLTDSHKKKFNKIASDEFTIFYQNNRFYKSGIVLGVFESSSLGSQLWHDDKKDYKYLIIIDELFDIDIPIESFNVLNNIY